MFARRPRLASRVHDPLSVQVLELRAAGRRVLLVSADILVVPTPLHRAVAARAGVPPEECLIAATHTHSGPGGYWNLGRRGELLMGAYRPELEALVVETITGAVRAARHAPGTRASLSVGRASVEGVSRNRRDTGGPVDPELLVVRLDGDDGPIDLVGFGAHPVVVAEEQPLAASADYPGALRERLRRRGVRAIFVQGAVGGIDPVAWTEVPAGHRLERMAERLEAAWEQAASARVPVQADAIELRRIDVPFADVACRVFPPRMTGSRAGELVLAPARRWVRGMGRAALRDDTMAPLHLLRIGPLGILFTPCDLGLELAQALKRRLAAAGMPYAFAGSHANGYFGYVHRRADYEHVPDGRDRVVTLYENAMSVGGWDFGEAFLARVDAALGC